MTVFMIHPLYPMKSMVQIDAYVGSEKESKPVPAMTLISSGDAFPVSDLHALGKNLASVLTGNIPAQTLTTEDGQYIHFKPLPNGDVSLRPRAEGRMSDDKNALILALNQALPDDIRKDITDRFAEITKTLLDSISMGAKAALHNTPKTDLAPKL